MKSLTKISISARASPLSRAQADEVLLELWQFQPSVSFEPHWLETTGDKDQKTSLRTLGKTDFFTKEVDALVLDGTCRIAIHSAKDLPDPLPKGLAMIALTRGVDPSDVLVFRDGETLPPQGIVGTSCERRENNVRALYPKAQCADIRGAIEKRLAQLDAGRFDAVVMAEAALLRLGLTHRTRIPLPGESAPLQGQLAIVARKDDGEMERLFSCLDTRKTILYLGTDPAHFTRAGKILHYPVIKIVPRTEPLPDLTLFTHLIFASKNAVNCFFALGGKTEGKHVIAVGAVTASHLSNALVAKDETQEGIIALLEVLDLEGAHIFLPRSSQSRPALENYLVVRQISHCLFDLYDTVPHRSGDPLSLDEIDTVVFTSPSTVKGFLEIYGKIPEGKEIVAQGPITKQFLEQLYKS
ncbi:MAG TPA: hydroxymethylbilane synthase [Rhabdochlamydiaceae bacterium]